MDVETSKAFYDALGFTRQRDADDVAISASERRPSCSRSTCGLTLERYLFAESLPGRLGLQLRNATRTT
jgi:hypothetical protein